MSPRPSVSGSPVPIKCLNKPKSMDNERLDISGGATCEASSDIRREEDVLPLSNVGEG
jgi:hypothetical protein